MAVADLPAGRGFYASAFGWTFNGYGPAYAGIVAPDGDGEIGGLNPSAQPSDAGPVVLLYSRDMDSTVESVRAAGREVLAWPYEFPGGRRFGFSDPSGNRLGMSADQ